MRRPSSTWFAAAVGAVAVAAIGVGISLIGSPGEERLRRLDAQRIADLQRLSLNIGSYQRAHDRLPERLEELELRERDKRRGDRAAL